MAKEKDVIVFDEEYRYASKEIKNYCNSLVMMISQYSKCVNIVLEKAIKDDKISSNLKNVLEQVEDVKEEISLISTKATSACLGYISEIDSADDFLY